MESPPGESVPAEERAAMEELLEEFFPVFFGAAYRVTLERRERWYVAGVNSA